MNKFRWFAGAMLAVSLAYAPVADAQSNWSGPYVGANLGGGITTDSGTHSCYQSGVLNGPTCRVFPYSGATGAGILGGVQAGYNFAFRPLFVIGGEADIQGASITSQGTFTGAPNFVNGTNNGSNTVFIAKQTVNMLGTLRARFGYTGFNRLMIYGTGGLAYTEERLSNTFSIQNFGTFAAYKNAFSVGWTAGAGAEYALSDHFSLKGEALYYDTGDTRITTNQITLYQHTIKFQTRGPIFRIGLNYAFGAPVAPPPATAVAAPAVPPPAAVVPAKQMFIVFFEFDKSSLTADGKKVVDAAATAFKSGKSSIAIAGFTDLAGSQQYNLALSKRRADTVKAALVKDGVSAAAIDESWHGKENPRVPTADGVREPQNRRVEITM
jgi:outer membrane protein OmpA-like peptidoglycan-associated protein